MSDSDSFIDEVSEEVRRDKLYATLKKYGWIPVLVIILVVGGTAYNEWSKAQTRAAAQTRGAALIAALAEDGPEARVSAIDAVDDLGTAEVLAQFQKAAILTEDNQIDAALAILDQVAISDELNPIYADLAKLKATILRGASVDQKSALEDLSIAGRPFRPLALEQLALVEVKTGDKTKAIEILTALMEEPNVTQAQRQRVSQTLVSLETTE